MKKFTLKLDSIPHLGETIIGSGRRIVVQEEFSLAANTPHTIVTPKFYIRYLNFMKSITLPQKRIILNNFC